MYDNVRQYHRDMYNDFCCLTTEAQNRVMECLNLDLRITHMDNIYQVCYDALLDIARNKIDDETGLYENGKYIHRALQHHASQKLPQNHDKKINHIADILVRSHQQENTIPPIRYLWKYYNAYNSNEINCCHITNLIAGYIAIYWGTKPEKQEKYYGDPGVCGTEYEIETMEDLFLWTLFYMYTYLVLPYANIDASTVPSQHQAKHKVRRSLKEMLQSVSALDVCKEVLLWILRTVYIATAVYTVAFLILGIAACTKLQIGTAFVGFCLAFLGVAITLILQLLCEGIKRESNANAIQTFAIIGTMVALIELIIKLTNSLLLITGA
jgi:hypothetical protein